MFIEKYIKIKQCIDKKICPTKSTNMHRQAEKKNRKRKGNGVDGIGPGRAKTYLLSLKYHMSYIWLRNFIGFYRNN